MVHKTFCGHILWTNEYFPKKLKFLENLDPIVSDTKLTAFHKKKITPTAKYGGSSVMVRGPLIAHLR